MLIVLMVRLRLSSKRIEKNLYLGFAPGLDQNLELQSSMKYCIELFN